MSLPQHIAPIYQAMQKLREDRVVPFDVPGHKGGRGNSELTRFLGADCLKADTNSMKPLDNLNHPVSVIKDAQQLAAEAFGARHAFFNVNGTTGAVQAMIMAVCKAGEKIIMPRNVHKSAINALVICGAIPVYVNPGVNSELGIPLGMSLNDIESVIEQHPDAKAIFVNNPTYYGICSDLERIVKIAHDNGMYLLADEAHGTHFYFGSGLPAAAIRVGADISSVSMHKTGGSLTQSSLLLCGDSVNIDYLRQIINLTQTTSASYLLLSSLDIARKNLALNGWDIFRKTVELAEYARNEINKIGFYAFSRELINGDSVFDFDATKLSVNTSGSGIAGIEVYDILRDEYNIQIEFGDIRNILAIISAGDRSFEIERLISSLSEVRRKHMSKKAEILDLEYIHPKVDMAPQQAFFSDKTSLPLDECRGKISGECVMCYPPGIPILAPGEVITEDILLYITYAKEKGCLMMGMRDMELKNLDVL